MKYLFDKYILSLNLISIFIILFFGEVSAVYSTYYFVNDTSVQGDYYTDGIGSNSNDGSYTSPFRTITYGLSVINEGDTLIVDVGIYNENITISKKNICIYGSDSSQVIIDLNDISLSQNAVSIVNVNQVTVCNLTIQNAYKGIYIDNSDSCFIYNNYIFSNNYHGLSIANNSNYNLIKNNNIQSNSIYGINIINSDSNNVIDNIISENNSYGIVLNTAYQNSISTNNIIDNTSRGIYLYNCRDNLLDNNSVVSNGSFGIYIYGSEYNRFEINTVANHNLHGFFISQSDNNFFPGNTVQNNSGIGVYISNAVDNIFSQNYVSSNSQYQIYLDGNTYSDTFNKNNIIPIAQGIYNNTSYIFDFEQNWWGTTDVTLINQYIDNNSLIDFYPYSLSIIDTSLDADTIAPAIPGNINADNSVVSQITITWMNPLLD